jgi:ribosome-associated protein
MAKKVTKKTTKPARSAAGKTAKKTAKKSVKTTAKKAVKKVKRTSSLASAGKKKVTKKAAKASKPATVKDKQAKAANVIANSEKKKSAKTKGKPTRRPVNTLTVSQTTALVDAIVDGMQEKKAKNITIVNLSGIENSVADFFVICEADSKTHVEAIADSVDEIVQKQTNERPFHAEGYENSEWILIDYINVVAHVFQKETRDYYNLEGLWADAEITLA